MMLNQCSSTWKYLAHTTPGRVRRVSSPLSCEQEIAIQLTIMWKPTTPNQIFIHSIFHSEMLFRKKTTTKKSPTKTETVYLNIRTGGALIAHLLMEDVILRAYAHVYISLRNWHTLAEISYRASESRAYYLFSLHWAVNLRTIVTGLLRSRSQSYFKKSRSVSSVSL